MQLFPEKPRSNSNHEWVAVETFALADAFHDGNYRDQPFTEPIRMPLTKYFCRNG